MAAYLLSDLHLGAAYNGSRLEAERRVVAFLDSIESDVTELYLLGDILDYWYEYRYVVPRGYVRFFGRLASLADRGVRIVWYIGNHDIWIDDYIPSELGVEVVDGWRVEQVGGLRIFMSHGDGVGKLPLGFRMIRSIFRNRICRRLYSMVNPRWTIPFAMGWSRHSRENGEAPGQEGHPLFDSLVDFSRRYLESHPGIDWFVYGHLHILRREEIAPGCGIAILGDWLTRFSYARVENGRLTLGTWRG